ncbi:MAG: hypothetical protein KDA85_10320 [Planctomycetaceae bacterium]|nr:hypothetical protein [Planctomycetaceae bacterium]
MLTRRTILSAAGLVAAAIVTSLPASAQFYGDGCSSCGQAVQAMPVAASCTPIQPVYSTCYQTVPVTTMAAEKQTVEVPYYQTSYEDREVTVYRPVTTTREVEMPTVSYQNVTEYRTLNRDMGRWTTNYHPVCKMAPCQVDPRPGVIGWFNRTSYSMRTAFQPNYTTSRQYVPNMVACSVPVTRQVAVQGTRRVAVQETRMVAERKTEKVAVQKLAYRKEEVTVMRPQTAYRTVPIGTSVAYGPGYGTQTAFYPFAGGTMTAWGIPVDSTRTAQRPEPDPISTKSADRSMFDDDAPRAGDSRLNDNSSVPVRGSSFQGSAPPINQPASSSSASDIEVLPAWGDPQAKVQTRDKNAAPQLAVRDLRATRGGWRAARPEQTASIQPARPAVSVADTEQ